MVSSREKNFPGDPVNTSATKDLSWEYISAVKTTGSFIIVKSKVIDTEIKLKYISESTSSKITKIYLNLFDPNIGDFILKHLESDYRRSLEHQDLFDYLTDLSSEKNQKKRNKLLMAIQLCSFVDIASTEDIAPPLPPKPIKSTQNSSPVSREELLKDLEGFGFGNPNNIYGTKTTT